MKLPEPKPRWRCRACGGDRGTYVCPKCKRVYCAEDCLPRHYRFSHVLKSRARKRLREALESEGIS